MTEISLNILDIVQNSIQADAAYIYIEVDVNTNEDTFTVFVEDDGCGMSPEQLAQAADPFYTTRTTRKVGLGLPFFKQAAESTGGNFSILSELGKGTLVQAQFVLSHIDRMPLGDINGTITTLILFNQDISFRYVYQYNGQSFVLDTEDIRRTLGDIPFDAPEAAEYIASYLDENKRKVDGGADI